MNITLTQVLQAGGYKFTISYDLPNMINANSFPTHIFVLDGLWIIMHHSLPVKVLKSYKELEKYMLEGITPIGHTREQANIQIYFKLKDLSVREYHDVDKVYKNLNR